MPFHPYEPSARHVWVMTTGEHGPPVAGVVLQWQHAPLHNAGGSPWQALVATTPFDDALVVRWVDASRLVELRDAAPVAAPSTAPDARSVRAAPLSQASTGEASPRGPSRRSAPSTAPRSSAT